MSTLRTRTALPHSILRPATSSGRNLSTATRVSRALVVADAGWFTTSSLFAELDRDDTVVLLLTCLDWRNSWRRGARPWTWNAPPFALRERLWQCDLSLPTGWMKRWPEIGMRPIARAVRDWKSAHAADAELTLVMTYPHYVTLHRQLEPTDSIYLNVDDYRLYWPACAAQVEAIEREALETANVTACVARTRTEELSLAFPQLSSRIIHLPHGAPRATIADTPHARPGPPPPDLAGIPGPRLGYVGSLEDRIDWALIDHLAERRPECSIILIGRPERDAIEPLPWQIVRGRALERPNVHCLGWRDQSRIAAYIAAFDACLIPYDVEHPFNRACNPTKIMDYMGSGRPIVATAVPECRLHSGRMCVAGGPSQFVDAIDSVLDAGSDDGGSAARHAFARENSCSRVAERLIHELAQRTTR